MLFVACSKPEKANSPDLNMQEVESLQTVETEQVKNFDLNSIPLSSSNLGDFPYIALPDGYELQNSENRNFERVPFWTGQNFGWVEGKLFSSGITPKSSYKEGGFLELQRNFESVITELGGVEVTHSQIPKEFIEQIPKEIKVQHSSGLGDIYNYPAQTFVIRQAYKNVWLHLAKSGNYMGFMVAESQPLNVTAKALTSSALKQSLDQDNKVSVQIE